MLRAARTLLGDVNVTPHIETPIAEPEPNEEHPITDRSRKHRTQTREFVHTGDTEWMVKGNCRFEPPATFFPHDGAGVEIAKRICATCVVKDTCLDYALANRIDEGVWGGTSERQRRRIIKKRRELGLA